MDELRTVRSLATANSVAPSWLANIGKLQARGGLLAEARAVLEEALQRSAESISNDRASIALLRGEIALGSGEFEEATEQLRTAHALLENANHMESLAFCLFQAGDLEGAEELYGELLSEPSVGWEAQEYWMLSHYHRGQVLEERGDIPSALDSYRGLAELWRNGDEDLVALQRVRRRIAELTGSH